MRDSALTIHGSLQADRLGRHFAHAGLRFTHIFSSDLQRAFKTAQAIRRAQPLRDRDIGHDVTVTPLCVLREQDFGFYEGKPFYSRAAVSKISGKDTHRSQHHNDPGFKDVESKEAMAVRMNNFLNRHLLPIINGKGRKDDEVVAVISHGIILANLWRCLLKYFEERSVTLAPGISIGNGGVTTLEHLGGWSNTGYLELDVTGQKNAKKTTDGKTLTAGLRKSGRSDASLLLRGRKMTIKTINGKDHLNGLKRTGGGLGSSKHDEGQKKIDGFFKKQKRG